MTVAIITGSAGLIGSEAAEFFSNKFDLIIGIDNNMRKVLFGEDATIEWNRKRLEAELKNYKHYNIDIRDKDAVENIFNEFNKDIKLVLHAADALVQEYGKYFGLKTGVFRGGCFNWFQTQWS